MGQSTSRNDAASQNRRNEVRRSRPLSAIFDRSLVSSEQESQIAPSQRNSSSLSSLLRPNWPRLPERDAADDERAHPSRRLRLSRSGSSFTTSFGSLLSRNRHMQPRNSQLSTDQSSTLLAATDSNGSLLSSPPQLHIPDFDSPLNFPSFDTRTSQTPVTSAPIPGGSVVVDTPVQTSSPSANRTTSSFADRIASLTPDRGFRNMTASLRRRRQPSNPQDDQTAFISRVLHFAASATAASLMGEEGESSLTRVRETQDTNEEPESDHRNFQDFLQALRSGSLESALGGAVRSSGDADARLTNPNGALDFFRMFRLGVRDPTRRRHPNMSRPTSRESGGDRTPGLSTAVPSSEEGEAPGRMIPILIVGIRALHDNHNDGVEGNREGMPAFLEAISNLPPAIGFGVPEDTMGEGRLRRRRAGLRGLGRRRSSMGGLNFFTPNRDILNQPHSADGEGTRPDGPTIDHQETPPGLNAPPTTPSSPPVSSVSSGTSSPTGRAAASRPVSNAGLAPRRDSFIRRMTGAPLESTAEEASAQTGSNTQRRLSDSDAIRLGSGSSRRNGVLMEPAGDSPNEGHRSWIIYILGGSYPENHPILSTPSLFTDSPTYEDMMLLSTLLGPAKPVVANEEDIASAGGLFTINNLHDHPIAVAIDGDERIVMRPGERCLICLSNYEDKEEARRLAKCKHLYHKECIDQWLTTGRNSCPLCRGQGVDEKSSDAGTAEQSATSNSQAPTASS